MFWFNINKFIIMAYIKIVFVVNNRRKKREKSVVGNLWVSIQSVIEIEDTK